MNIAQFFDLRGELPKRTKTILEISGLILLMVTWEFTSLWINNKVILPSPVQVYNAFVEILCAHSKETSDGFWSRHTGEGTLLYNLGFSLKINLLGYLVAICISVPVGFMLGLFPIFKAISGRYIDAIRFVPLNAITGLFIVWFGIGTNMKVEFLAFGIIVYMLPVVVQRIMDVEQVYVDTVYTLGASKWQTIWNVFLPSVMAKLFDDIRVLVAISWTYIIIAELINNEGGIGGMIYGASRRSRTDVQFALLALIVVVGILQDKAFVAASKKIFKFKYV